MLVSYNWLQSYFKDKIPTPEKISELFTMSAFEVDSFEKKGNDFLFDIKVLPDRACYALCHRGIVGELSAITSTPIQEMQNEKDFPKIGKTPELKIKIENEKLCPRYIGRRVLNVDVGQSEGWLKELLETIGQRAINTVVDSANFVMFDIGQPLHAFDADKVKGEIVVRLANKGEKIELLHDTEVAKGGVVAERERLYEFKGDELVIADDLGPIALAGIKGGERTKVSEGTKNLILESANFDSVYIRKISNRLELKSDASKRYENKITPNLAEKAMDEFSVFLDKFCKTSDTVFGEKVDVYPEPAKQKKISFDHKDAERILGIKIPESEIVDVLSRLQIGVEKKVDEMDLTVPFERLDLVITEDIVDEIARLYGYDKMKAVSLEKSSQKPSILKSFYWSAKIKDTFVSEGFSEVLLYTLVAKGDIEIEHPLASDKAFLRTNLSDGIKKCLEFNSRNADFLGLDAIKIFEIGRVFGKKDLPAEKAGEYNSLAIGVSQVKKIKGVTSENIIKEAISDVEKTIGIKLSGKIETTPVGSVFEINLDEVFSKLKSPSSIDVLDVPKEKEIIYKKISAFPFAARDVAVFVPNGVSGDKVLDIIKKEGGELLVRTTLFDTFTKTFPDGSQKESFAFRLIFQSMNKTLSEQDISSLMEKITKSINLEKDWQVR
ncbi:MAG: phenylalanine--tRNA ligase subunit beta [Parcubacteria group bacterium]|nr:phenylalanine--tRNA ligase subunit beta [Parcubacteria group bacterium]